MEADCITGLDWAPSVTDSPLGGVLVSPSVVHQVPKESKGRHKLVDGTPLALLPSDSKAFIGIIDTLIARSGLKQAEIARRLNIKPQTLDQYRHRAINPTMKWFIRFAAVCGTRVFVELAT